LARNRKKKVFNAFSRTTEAKKGRMYEMGSRFLLYLFRTYFERVKKNALTPYYPIFIKHETNKK
jgi:hypothetical protein